MQVLGRVLMFNERERELIIKALYMLETAYYAKELHYEIEDELGGTPDPDEVRALMDRVKESERFVGKIADWIFTKIEDELGGTWSDLDRDETVEALKKLLR